MPDVRVNSDGKKKRCFVVMGFGTKTDFATGRKINLDNSYNALIKPVLIARGLDCIRADEIRHAGTIDLPMYQQLLTADIVIADLSTANINAFYELGIRHALRPRTTIVISEQQLCYPFDLSHILITKYETLGDKIDYFEVLRFQKVLGNMLDELLKSNETDSPVYTFLDDLIPPSLRIRAHDISREISEALLTRQKETATDVTEDTSNESKTLSILVTQAEESITARHYILAKKLLESAIEISNCNSHETNFSANAYLIQRLAMVTYKTKSPDTVSSLKESIALLNKLDLQHTNDTETVALAGKIEKRLYYHGEGDEHLKNAIMYFERAHYLLHNRYHGINLAFLLNWRVNSPLYDTEEDKIADMMWANRYRREVLEMCERDHEDLKARSAGKHDEEETLVNSKVAVLQQTIYNEELHWILVNKAEAHLGLGEIEAYRKADGEARALSPPSWMLQGYEGQVTVLKGLLEQYGHLQNPPWPKKVSLQNT